MRSIAVPVTVAFAATVLAAGPASATDPFGELELIRPTRLTLAPDFGVPSVGRDPIRLREFRGQVVFVNFWATWCPPCKEEMPSMERLYRRFKTRGFTILALSLDTADAATVAGFVKSLGLTFPIGLDPKLEVAQRYGILGLPASFLIDKAGRTAAIALGPRDWDSRAAHAVIEVLLK